MRTVRHDATAVVSVNWWKSNWHQPSTSEQLTSLHDKLQKPFREMLPAEGLAVV